MAGIYLHIPFCAKRCIYCDFYFVTTQHHYEPFTDALIAEMAYYGERYGKLEPVETIYFGGGTPSLLPLELVGRLMLALEAHFDTSALTEVTFEVNPDDLTQEYLIGLKSMGINRLSVGIQSFFEDDLAFMGRSHAADQAEAALHLIPEAGFENYTVDLIFGIPDQPGEHWGANLEKLWRAGVPHISTYGLTVEEKTPLFKLVSLGRVAPVDEEAMTERYLFTIDFLRERGYEHYEISSFAKPGFRAQHNQLYWNHVNYLGFGPSAHSFWRGDLMERDANRWSNVRNIKQYEALLSSHQLPLDQKERITLDTLADEHIMLRLRTSEGLDLDYLEEHYGVDMLSERIDELAWLESEGHIFPIRNGRVVLTDTGKLLCDRITEKMLG